MGRCAGWKTRWVRGGSGAGMERFGGTQTFLTIHARPALPAYLASASTPSRSRPMPERIDRLWSWLCFRLVLAIPTHRLPRWLWWWAVPWAGNHAHWWSMTDEERRMCRETLPDA